MPQESSDMYLALVILVYLHAEVGHNSIDKEDLSEFEERYVCFQILWTSLSGSQTLLILEMLTISL